MKRIITYGTFDLLHYGHINLLKRAKALGDYLIVALSTDEFNWDEKRKKCYFSYEKRKALLEAIRYVDLVIPENNWDQKRSDMHEYHIDTFVMGDDWKGKFDFLEDEGVEVVYLPRTPEISTTQIKNDLNNLSNNIDDVQFEIFDSPEKSLPDLSARKDLEEEYDELLEKYEVDDLSPLSINDYYFDEKLDENSILVVGLGVNVRGNMQYVLNELNTNPKYEKFKIYVRTKPKTDDIVKQYIKQNGWARTTTVVKNYSKKLESCKYMITESYFPYSWIKKEGQVLIDLWHGTPLKRLGLEKEGQKCHLHAIQQKNFMNADYLLFPNEYTEDKLLGSHRVETLMHSKALMLGYPRTGGMLAVSDDRKNELKALLAPNGEKIFAYMPTFRGYLSNKKDAEQKQKLMDYLDDNLQDDQILYVNLHHKIDDCIDYSVYQHIKKFPALVDSYELMAVTDALISDYSSVFFDYLILGKQIILYITDYDEYVKHHGVYFDIRELPFDIASSEKDVLDALNRGKQYDDSEVRKFFCSYDTAENAKKVCQLMLEDETGLELHNCKTNNKKKALVYTYCAEAGKETALLHEFTKMYDSDRYELFLSCESDETDKVENKDSAYPMIAETPVIGSSYDPMLSSTGRAVKELYLSRKISFEKAIAFLQYEYALIPKRMYGEAKFDTLFIYDVVEPEVIIGLSLMEAGSKYLFLQDAVFEKISKGDTFLQDAVMYASKYCKGIFVSAEKRIAEAETLVDSYWSNKIQVVKDAKDLNKILEL